MRPLVRGFAGTQLIAREQRPAHHSPICLIRAPFLCNRWSRLCRFHHKGAIRLVGIETLPVLERLKKTLHHSLFKRKRKRVPQSAAAQEEKPLWSNSSRGITQERLTGFTRVLIYRATSFNARTLTKNRVQSLKITQQRHSYYNSLNVRPGGPAFDSRGRHSVLHGKGCPKHRKTGTPPKCPNYAD